MMPTVVLHADDIGYGQLPRVATLWATYVWEAKALF